MVINKVSVILATYNGAHLLSSTLRSLDDQNVGTMAVSICDDASVDETFDLVSSWAKTTRHEVHISRNSVNSGPSKTFEKAMLSATTDFVIILGQDDTLEPRHVTNLLSLAKNEPDIAAVMPMDSRSRWRNQMKFTSRNLIADGSPGWASVIRLLGGNAFFAPGTLVRRAFWRPSTMHPANLQAQDYELWLYLALRGRLIQCNQPVKYGIHANNLHNCDPLDHDLDVGLTLRRFLKSNEFNSIRSKLQPSDREALDCAVRERLEVHSRTKPLIYAAATIDTRWESNAKSMEDPLRVWLSESFDTKNLSNLDFNLRAQLLGELNDLYHKPSSMLPIGHKHLKSPIYHRRFSMWLKRAFNERKANQRIQNLASPWTLSMRQQDAG